MTLKDVGLGRSNCTKLEALRGNRCWTSLRRSSLSESPVSFFPRSYSRSARGRITRVQQFEWSGSRDELPGFHRKISENALKGGADDRSLQTPGDVSIRRRSWLAPIILPTVPTRPDRREARKMKRFARGSERPASDLSAVCPRVLACRGSSRGRVRL